MLKYSNPEYKNAIIGFSFDGRLIYDYKMIDSLMEEDNMSEEEAIEFLDYNTLHAYISENGKLINPIIVEVLNMENSNINYCNECGKPCESCPYKNSEEEDDE